VRENKFKAWNKHSNRWADPTEFAPKTEHVGDCVYQLFAESFIICWYTGLKDKKGTEIYEGDIFKAPHDFGPGGWSVKTSSVPIDHNMDIQWQYWNLDELEVIGNIYEHSELLNA